MDTMADKELQQADGTGFEKCLQASTRIYGSWDASENSTYGFIYRTALIEIEGITFQKRNSSRSPPENTSYFNNFGFVECHPATPFNGGTSQDSEYFVCLEMKNVKCYTLRSLPFRVCFKENSSQYELSTNVVMCVKYPHFNHLKANFMTLSIQKKNKNKHKLLKSYQSVAHVHINMEYVLQNSRINSVTLDCNKSKLFQGCEIHFKSISTNPELLATKPSKKSFKNRWQIKGLPYPQVKLTRIFSPKLKRNFSYTKNTNVFNVASGSEEEQNTLCFADSSDSVNEISIDESVSSLEATLMDHQDEDNLAKNASFIQSIVNTPELTPDAIQKLILNQSSSALPSPVTEEKNHLDCRKNLKFTTPAKSTTVVGKNKQKIALTHPTSSGSAEKSNSDDSNNDNYTPNPTNIVPKSNRSFMRNDPNGLADNDEISDSYDSVELETSSDSADSGNLNDPDGSNDAEDANNPNNNRGSLSEVPENILVYFSDGISNVSRRLYEIVNSFSHPSIHCVRVERSDWIRQFMEEWNKKNSTHVCYDASLKPKTRIFLFGNDKTINSYINVLATCPVTQHESLDCSTDGDFNFVEFLFIPIEFPSCYFEHFSKIASPSLYSEFFGGVVWREFIDNLSNEVAKEHDSRKLYDELVKVITSDYYELVQCPIGRAILTANACTAQDATPRIPQAFLFLCQILNHSQKKPNGKYIIEYDVVDDNAKHETRVCGVIPATDRKEIKVKARSSQISFVPKPTHVEISVVRSTNDSCGISRKLPTSLKFSSSNSDGLIKGNNVKVYRRSKYSQVFNVIVDGIVHEKVCKLDISCGELTSSPPQNAHVKTVPVFLPRRKSS